MNLSKELRECQVAAEEGYQLAQGKYNEIKDTLADVAVKISMTDREQSQVKRIQNTELIERQKTEIQRLIEHVKSIDAELKRLRMQAKDFSIVVYGRTMAGKSTLMEILTHGDGQSIGKGSQRTTRDVRDYYWQGLKITDVPGICAFEGAEDERLALEAAKSADLILFLLTSDAPQPDEAACLAQLKSFGKPILGLINVKESFSMSRRALSLKKMLNKLNSPDETSIPIEQFKKYAANHNQDWSGIKFVATHLLSAYQSQDKDAEVFAASRFAQVEEFIMEKVRNDGRFLRIKTFIDAVAVPMNDTILKIYEQSATSLLESNLWSDKADQLSEWSTEFMERSKRRFEGLYNELSTTLKNEIQKFADRHYEDEKINQTWPTHVKGLGLDTRYQNLLQELAGECERKRKELSDELRQQMKYAYNGNTKTNIELEGTTAWGEYGAALLGGVGGFFAARAIGIAFPPLGIALAAVSLLGWIFSDSKEEKIRKAKKKLREDLTKPSFEMLDKMHNQVMEIFNKDIWNKGVCEFWNLLAGYQFMLAHLGKSQYKIARALNKKFSDLNAKLLEEAIVYKGAGFISSVDTVARVPGETIVAFADRAKLNLDELSNLLGEKVSVIKPEEKLPNTVKKILNCDVDNYFFQCEFDTKENRGERAIAVFPKNKVDATSFKIAQQIAGVPIIAEITQPQRTSTLPNVNSSSQSTSRSTQTNTPSSGGRTQSNDAFDSDFKRIDAMFAKGTSNYAIRQALDSLKQRARNLRNAYAMRKIAAYYDKACDSGTAYACREEAKTFAR